MHAAEGAYYGAGQEHSRVPTARNTHTHSSNKVNKLRALIDGGQTTIVEVVVVVVEAVVAFDLKFLRLPR